MSEMTTNEAIEVLKELQALIKDGRSMFNLTLKDKQALDKAIEVMGVFAQGEKFIEKYSKDKECQHPYHMVHTRCMGEINTCLQCGEEL